MASSSSLEKDKYQLLQEKRANRPERAERQEREESRIKRDIRGWIGWDFIQNCADLCVNPLAIILTFLTGGRAIEVLDYTRGMFADMGGYIEGRFLPVYKRYKVIDIFIDPITGKKTFSTQLETARRTIPLMKTEPLVALFWELIEHRDPEEYLLQWPQKNQYWQLYRAISQIPVPFSPLAPLYHKGENEGQQKNIYPHWLRGMRAAQLRVQYNLSIDKLCDFFGWLSIDMARHYAGLTSLDMVIAIRQGERFNEIFERMMEEENK